MSGGVRGKYVARFLDDLMTTSLAEFARDMLGTPWCGKENDWVNRFAHGYLLRHVNPTGVLYDPAQIGIEVAVPQPPGFVKQSTRRDLVIWPEPGGTCWDADWNAVHHPLAIVEWKVHRPRRRNRDQEKEREWLRRYTRWQPGSVAFAVEIDLGCAPRTLVCRRFRGGVDEEFPRGRTAGT